MERMMKTLSKNVWISILVALCLSACEKLSLPEQDGEKNSLLEVHTRTVATSVGATVSYPVHVYVFSGTSCVALQTIADASQNLSIPLMEGSYTVFAIGGASTENYALPSKEEATPSMVIALKEGKTHGDLMTASSQVTLADGQTNALTLTLERKVMLLQSVVMENMPSTATEVTVTLSPLWTSLAGTNYTGDKGQASVALTKQADGKTWSFAGTFYLMPPSGEVTTVTVRIVKPNGTTTYAYNLDTPFEAGDRLNIESAYTGALNVTLTGTIAGDSWKEEKNISFDFDEDEKVNDESGNNGNTEEEEDVLTGTAPAVGSTYQTCFVLAVTENDGVSEVLLLSPNQHVMSNLSNEDTPESAMEKVEAAMPECVVEGINGWRLMTRAEALLMSQTNKAPDVRSGSNNRYLLTDDGVLKPATIGIGSVTPVTTFAATNILRPVAIVRFRSSN